MALRRLHNSSRESRESEAFTPERNLACAVLRQAWEEAVMDLGCIKETTRKNYSVLKKSAIQWISSNNDGFVYWCQLADMNHVDVRERLQETLKVQHCPEVVIADSKSA